MNITERDKKIIQIALGFVVGMAENEQFGKDVSRFLYEHGVKPNDVKSVLDKVELKK
jgi:hypothetical protein